jgi:hypothetical protein
MPCTAKKTLETAAAVQANIIVQLKDNQPTLLQRGETLCASRDPETSDTSVTQGRNRHETRTADVFRAARAVAATEWISLIKRIVRITRDVLHRNARTGLWSSTSEVANYLANSAASARQVGNAIRGRWHIENKLHYTGMSPSGKINPASSTIQASSPGCAHSPITSCSATALPRSARSAMLSRSVASMRYSSYASVESVEQPWPGNHGERQLRGDSEHDGVARQRCQVGERCAEALHRQPLACLNERNVRI